MINKIEKETSSVKHIILPYIEKDCYGIDIGFGGDLIREDFVSCDLPVPYGDYEGYKIDIPCDVSKGIPVKDNTFDVVYSSHLIEDFENTEAILEEFIRILKDQGTLILVFPDQKKYEEDCKLHGTVPNVAHKIKDMGLMYVYNKLVNLEESGAIDSFTATMGIEIPPYNCIIISKIYKKNV